MSRIYVRNSRPEDVQELAPRMRPEDALEVSRASGHSAHEALRRAFASSSSGGVCRTFVAHGEVVAMWGCAPSGERPDVGIIWMLGSNLVKRYAKSFLQICPSELVDMLERFPVLMNAVDDDYAAAKRWLKWLGAELAPPVDFGPKGHPFRWFWFKREDACVT